MPKITSVAYAAMRATAAAFDAKREALAAECLHGQELGMTLKELADSINSQGVTTRTGKSWTGANIWHLMKRPVNPTPKPISKGGASDKRATGKKKGVHRSSDISLGWVAAEHPELAEWRELGALWLNGKELGLATAIAGVNKLIAFIVKNKLPREPGEFFLYRTPIPDFYASIWGSKRTHANILVHNTAHYFLEWALTQPQFCEADDEGVLRTSPAFRNPLPHLSRSGLPLHYESVRITLPYGYIEELRKMIAEGANFSDWKWAQGSLGVKQSKPGRGADRISRKKASEEEGEKLSPVWFEVEASRIDRSDPDCVWRSRSRILAEDINRRKGHRRKETIYEMWSPVRWVATLIKLQLPLRTFQVRMLDSGEADTWRWERNEWKLNVGPHAVGSESQPYSNGVFRQANRVSDGGSQVILHINTNKTADIGKEQSHKGYSVPWIVGGPIHQDPFYWFEKLRAWQEKYNRLKRLIGWDELDARHIPAKSAVQLAAYPKTAFLFRTPEVSATPHFPIATVGLDRIWFVCLETLEKRIAARNETLPGGGPIRLLPQIALRKKYAATTLFPMHSLRVSLMTALAIDGGVPLGILQQIAGHSRLVMTLYYIKPGAKQSQEALQAGVHLLNENADNTIVDWLANTEYAQLIKDVIANSLEAFKAAVPDLVGLRAPVGWMVMLDGLCLVGGNNSELDSPGCHNGGPNIGNDTSPKYAPTPGGPRNCPRCRWFITRPYFLPQLAARWNNANYHCSEAKNDVVRIEERFREIENSRAATLSAGLPFGEQRKYLEVQRQREQVIKRFEDSAMNVAAITRLIERCRKALLNGDGSSLIANGGTVEIEYVIEEVDSELLQISGVCEGSLLYPDLDPGKAVLRQSQILDSAFIRDELPPVFLMLSEEEQRLVGSAVMRNLAEQMNPSNPNLGRYQVISLIDAGQSLRQRLGSAVKEILDLSMKNVAPRRFIPIKAMPSHSAMK